MSKKNLESPPGGFRQTLFWDVDPTTIDPEKHARYVIERIMDFGNDAEVRWMNSTYAKRLLQDVLRTSVGMTPKSRNFWELMLFGDRPTSNIKKHWSVAPATHEGGPRAIAQWELENRINFGIGTHAISKTLLKQVWDRIDIDPWKRKALALALE